MAARILYLIDSLGVGGAEHGLVLTLAHLDRERFAPEVAYLWEPSRLTGEIEALDVPVHRIRARKGDWSLASVPKVRKLLKDGDFDLIDTSLTWSSIVGRAAGRAAGIKVVSHIASAPPEEWVRQALPPKQARRAKNDARLEGLTGKWFMDRSIAPSDGGPHGPGAVSVVHQGLDLGDLRERAALPVRPPVLDPGEPCLLTVGRLAAQKGQRYLIDAMHAVLMEFPHARLLVAGEGSLRRMLEDRARPFGDRVAFLGAREDIPALLAHADLFVLPSLWEGQGSALIEAMAIGRPIVATKIPAVMDAVRDGETGVLARAGDSAGLAESMLRVLRDPKSAKAMAKRAQGESERFDITSTTRELEAVYDQVLAERQS